MTSANSTLYGYLLEFRNPEQLVDGVRALMESGYRNLEAFTPFPVDELNGLLPAPRNPIPLIMLLGGLLGIATGYGVQWYTAVIDYPILAGGKPMHSWPAFVPVTFELMVLFSALAGFIATWWTNGLPRLHHPVFAATDFDLASKNRFFLLVETNDPRFDEGRSLREFARLPLSHVHPVPNEAERS